MIKLTASQGEYLKGVYELSLKGRITVTNVAEHLNFSKPSVVRGLKTLDKMNMIEYSEKDIKLTEIGEVYAKNIIRRDHVLKKFFTEVLGIEEALAEEEVYNLVHNISCYTVTKLEEYVTELLGEDIDDTSDYCICSDDCDNCTSCER